LYLLTFTREEIETGAARDLITADREPAEWVAIRDPREGDTVTAIPFAGNTITFRVDKTLAARWAGKFRGVKSTSGSAVSVGGATRT
jgi:hypothetical protein